MKKYVLPIFIACIPLAYAAFLYDSLPESIPVHFNMNGEVDRYGGKNQIFIGGAVALFVLLILELSLRFDPKKSLHLMGSNFDNFKLALVCIMSILGCFMVHSMANGFDKSSFKYMFIAISCLMIIMGNYLSSVRPNYFIGIRTPWTLESNQVWAKTHRIASKLFMGIGLVGLILSLFNPMVFLVFLIGGTLVVTAYTLWYSHHLFKLEQASKDA